MARAFGYLSPLQGDQIAIVTNAGGPGILATDALERAGLKLARFKPECIKALEQFLPDAASAANPIDILGDARADRYRFALEQVIESPSVDGILVILTPQAMTEIVETAAVIAEISEKVDIPILASFMGEARVEAGIEYMAKAGIEYMAKHNVPNFAFPERAAMVLQAMSHYREYRARPLPSFESFDVDQKAVRETIDRVLDEGRLSIGDAEAKSILTAYGLQAPPSEIAETAEKAVEIAADMGYPVVLKIASPDILHKTDVGGVKVGLQNATDVRDAFDLITYRSQRYLPEARLWGCQVQKMVPSGLEILIGMNRDPQFGPLVTFGLGGIYVEALKDASFRIAPFSREEAAQTCSTASAASRLLIRRL
jgi:acetyltransferase